MIFLYEHPTMFGTGGPPDFQVVGLVDYKNAGVLFAGSTKGEIRDCQYCNSTPESDHGAAYNQQSFTALGSAARRIEMDEASRT